MPLPIPKFIKTAFANIGLRNNIPEITNNTTGTAGYDRGFGEINMLPEGAGGIPPDGKDFNGIFYDLSSAIQYAQSGMHFPFNQEFATAIGGYGVGAVVSDPVAPSALWINGVSGNTAFPAGWSSFRFGDPTETVRGSPLVATQAEVNAGVNNSKMVTPKNISAAFGVGQTLQDVTGSRVGEVIYTNITGKPIGIYIDGVASIAADSYIAVRVGGSPASIRDASVSRSPVAPGGLAAFAIVPVGGSYSAIWRGLSSVFWREMR